MEPISRIRRINKMNQLKPMKPNRQVSRIDRIKQRLSVQWEFKTARKKAVRYFGIFLLFMICCTIISRGIYAYQMPRVQIGQAAQKSISHTISIMGSIEAARETAVILKDGIRIEEICVKEGEKVEADTELLRLDLADLKALIESLDKQISVEQEHISALKNSSLAEEQTRQTARQRAREDFTNIAKTQDEAVRNAQKAQDEAGEELSVYPNWNQYLSETRQTDSQYQTLKKAAAKKSAAQEDKDTFAAYDKELQVSARTSWEEGKKALEANLEAKKQELSAATREREAALRQAERDVRDVEQHTPVDKSGIMEAENALTGLWKQRTDYQQLLKKKGRITSKRDGYVKTICVSAGDRSTDSAAMFLADGSDGWNFTAPLNEEQMQQIKVGDTVALKFQNGTVQEEDCPVLAVSKTAEGTYETVVKVTENGLSLGEIGTLEITAQTVQYPCSVPLSALYTENNKDYILLIREQNTILGTELRVVKREVTVRDKNESAAALDDSALGTEDQFVVYSNKAVVPGDKVRLLEQEDKQIE